MSDVVMESSEGVGASDDYAALASLNDGFLGTGYTSAVEASFIAMALILGYVAVSTARYFLAGTRVMDSVAASLGLRDD